MLDEQEGADMLMVKPGELLIWGLQYLTAIAFVFVFNICGLVLHFVTLCS